MSNFDQNAILRGAQLTLVGGESSMVLVSSSIAVIDVLIVSISCSAESRSLYV